MIRIEILIALSMATQLNNLENVKCLSSFLNSQIPLSGSFQLFFTIQTIDLTIDWYYSFYKDDFFDVFNKCTQQINQYTKTQREKLINEFK